MSPTPLILQFKKIVISLRGRHPSAGLSLNLAIKLWVNPFLKQCSSNPSAPALIDLTPKGSSQVVKYLYSFTNPEIVFFRSPPPFRRGFLCLEYACDVETFAILIFFLLLKEEERQSRRTDSLTVPIPVNAMSRMRVSGGSIVFSIQNDLMETQENKRISVIYSLWANLMKRSGPSLHRKKGREDARKGARNSQGDRRFHRI